MSCGELGPIEGGLIKDSTVVNSNLMGCSLQSASLDSCSLQNLAEIDAASALSIAAAIASNPAAAALISALLSPSPSSSSVVLATPEDPTAGNELPTDIYGARSAVLGEPASWIELGGYAAPVYRKACSHG